MGYLSGSNITNYRGSNFKIIVSGSEHQFIFDNGRGYYDTKYVQVGCADYTGSYSRVLVAGLGIGVIPQWFAKEKQAIVDVVEINPEIIDVVKSFGYLDDNINIIEGDIFNFNPSGSYDLAVMDIWFDFYTPLYYEQTGSLITKYSSSADIVSIPFRNI